MPPILIDLLAYGMVFVGMIGGFLSAFHLALPYMQTGVAPRCPHCHELLPQADPNEVCPACRMAVDSGYVHRSSDRIPPGLIVRVGLMFLIWTAGGVLAAAGFRAIF